MSGIVYIASGGVIGRADRCVDCGRTMFFHLDEADRPFEMFCGLPECLSWLVVLPTSGPDAQHGTASDLTSGKS